MVARGHFFEFFVWEVCFFLCFFEDYGDFVGYHVVACGGTDVVENGHLVWLEECVEIEVWHFDMEEVIVFEFYFFVGNEFVEFGVGLAFFDKVVP